MYFDSIDDSKKPAIIRIVLLGATSFIAIAFLSIKSVIPSIEKDILNNVNVALMENKLPNILVTVTGQDITLEGFVTEQIQDKAIQVISQIKGVENVTSEFILVDSVPVTGKVE
jgi:hypothetical protein